MNLNHIVYVSCVSGVFVLVIGMCIRSLYRDSIYFPRHIYKNEGKLRENIELTDYNSDDEEDRDAQVISERL